MKPSPIPKGTAHTLCCEREDGLFYLFRWFGEVPPALVVPEGEPPTHPTDEVAVREFQLLSEYPNKYECFEFMET